VWRSFSPTKELAAMMEAVIMGIIRKNTGRIELNISPAKTLDGSSPTSSAGSLLRRTCRSGSLGEASKAAIRMEGIATVITSGTISRGRNSRLLEVTPRKSL